MLNECTEKQFSEVFDFEYKNELPYIKKDKPAIYMLFHNFKDSLHRNNQITDSQVNNYCYKGKYSK